MLTAGFWSDIADALHDKFNAKVSRSTEGKVCLSYLYKGVWYAIPIDSKYVVPRLTYFVGACSDVHLNKHQIKEIKDILTGDSMFSGSDPINVYRRVAHKGNKIAVLMNNTLSAVMIIDDEGFRYAKDIKCYFHFSEIADPLPTPVVNANPDEVLREFQPLTGLSNEHFRVFMCSLVRAFISPGPYPIVGITGDPGLGSMLGFMFKSIVDPERGPVRSLPLTERDLNASMGNAHMIAYEVSTLPSRIASALARHAEGCASSRSLGRGDDDEFYFWADRFFLLIGNGCLTGSDNLSRQLVLLQTQRNFIPSGVSDSNIRERFLALRPKILGVLFNAISYGLKNNHNVHPTINSNISDNMKLAIQSLSYFGWSQQKTMHLLEDNKNEVMLMHAESDIIVFAILSLLKIKQYISCPPTELFDMLQTHLKETGNDVALRSFPIDPATLGVRLRKAVPALRAYGAECIISHPHKSRLVTLRFIDSTCTLKVVQRTANIAV